MYQYIPHNVWQTTLISKTLSPNLCLITEAQNPFSFSLPHVDQSVRLVTLCEFISIYPLPSIPLTTTPVTSHLDNFNRLTFDLNIFGPGLTNWQSIGKIQQDVFCLIHNDLFSKSVPVAKFFKLKDRNLDFY